MKRFRYFGLIVVLLFTACGGGGGSSSSTNTSSNTIIGYLIDAPVVNMTYKCGGKIAKTGSDGRFECSLMPVIFMVGTLEVGKLNTITADGKVYPQDLAGVERSNIADPEVLKIASFLQSLDDDGDIRVAITIPNNLQISGSQKLSEMTLAEVENLIRELGRVPVTLAAAATHLLANTPATSSGSSSSSSGTSEEGSSSSSTTTSTADTIVPVITLNGSATITMFKGKSYTELGATAIDNKDGTLTSSIVTTGTVITTTVGTYTITYKVSDTAGNQATKTRTVKVILGIPILANSTATTEENATVGVKIGTVSISSIGDKNITAITLSGTGNGNFSVSKDGNITIKVGSALNYETTKDYNLTAVATNPTGLSSSVKVNITVTNVVDIVPLLSAATISLDENVSIGTTVVTVRTNGSSSDQNVTDSFTIVSGNTGDDFNISTTGVISTRKILDFERTGSYTLKVKATNRRGDSALVDVVVTIRDANEVTISGTVTYDLVPVDSSDNRGLKYADTTQAQAKGVVVEVVDSSNQVLNSTTTDANGAYSLTNIGKAEDVKIRVYARLLKAGTPSWDFKVLDNTNSDSLYVMEGAVASSGTATSQTRDLNAPSGWDGSAYTTTRVAAPFAILGTVYKSMDKIKSVDANIVFPPLTIYWSKNNISSTTLDTANGQIFTSHYNGTALYILGKADNDTDEYDDHVIAHEWGHYYEAKFSRSDSIGGSHGSGEKLDIRVAFGEGFANAFSGMTLDNPVYFDSLGSNQDTGWSMNLEHETHTTPGWFSEASIQRILYDIYDSANDSTDANDALSLGFGPIHTLFTSTQKTTPAFTSIFSFIKGLKDANTGSADAIKDIVASEDIAEITDIYGNGRTGTPYSTLTVGGATVQVCLSTANGNGNKLDNRKYLKLNMASTGSIDIQTTEGDGADAAMTLYKTSPFANLGFFDRIQGTLEAGDYLIDISDHNNTSNPPCFDINATN